MNSTSACRLFAAAAFVSCLGALAGSAPAAVRLENFDREPAGWEGINNRNKAFEPRTVVQDFGYSATSHRAGGREPGEIGGRINPAGETAFYGYRLPEALGLNSPLNAKGRLLVAPGAGHFLFGFFNTNSAHEWRTPNSLVARINGRGETFHCHFEYATSKWRAGAGVIGTIVPGERISAAGIPCGRALSWEMAYDPNGAAGHGVFTFTLDGVTAQCEFTKDHRAEGITVTHFGLLPVMKAWDSPGDAWLDDVTINGKTFDFSSDPKWDEFNNRRTYVTTNIRPKFDFGWSATQFAGGHKAGELGGLIFRGDCREPARMAAYGDRLQTLTLEAPFEVRGKIALLRAISDSTASIGFYHSVHSMAVNPSQKHSIPCDYVGVNIEGPSAEGFFFYPVYRTHTSDGVAGYNRSSVPRIYPDGKVHDWFLRYDPGGANGRGKIVVGLGGQTTELELAAEHKRSGATFDRFGICTPWIDGNSVTVYFDDLTYTSAP